MHLAQRSARIYLLTCLSLTSAAAYAEDTSTQTQPAKNWADEGWHVVVGAGAADIPRYPGSSSRRSVVVPVLSATYGRYFLGGVPGSGSPAGLGFYLHQDSHWRVGMSFAYDFVQPRKESDDARLRGLGDIKRTAHATVFASYTTGWLTVRGNVASDIAGNHQGTTASLELEGKYRVTDKLTLQAGPGVTWANSQYNQTFFGVDATQSLRSGYAVYTPKSGIQSLRFSIGADYRISDRWSAGVRATAAQLQGDAADSPIVEKKMQNIYSVYTFYRF